MNVSTKQLVAYAHVIDVERSIRFYADLGFGVANSVTRRAARRPFGHGSRAGKRT